MAAANWFRYFYLAQDVAPKDCSRAVSPGEASEKMCRIVEVGVSDVRPQRVAHRSCAALMLRTGKVSFTGIDWFEVRSQDLPTLSLKEAYRVLRATEANVRLVPGMPGAITGRCGESRIKTLISS